MPAAGKGIARVAQWLEPAAHNGLVGGSSPSSRTINPLILKQMNPIKIYIFFAIFVAEITIINSIAVAKNNSVVASWYQAGRKTASGQRFDPNGNTVAHRTLPFGTKLKLTNPNNGRSIIATVNDRGPFRRGTGLDVSRGVAHKLGFVRKGKTKLKMQVMR